MGTRRLPHLLAGMLLLGAALAGCGGPEDRLVAHIESMAEILDDNLDDPAAGVEEMEAYLIRNLGEIAAAATELVVEIYEIDDESDAKERVEEVKKALDEAMNQLKKAADDFERTARGNADAEKATKRIQERITRLGRLAALVD